MTVCLIIFYHSVFSLIVHVKRKRENAWLSTRSGWARLYRQLRKRKRDRITGGGDTWRCSERIESERYFCIWESIKLGKFNGRKNLILWLDKDKTLDADSWLFQLTWPPRYLIKAGLLQPLSLSPPLGAGPHAEYFIVKLDIAVFLSFFLQNIAKST